MKTNIVQETNQFKPITIEITIENEEELRYMWHLSNVPKGAVKDTSLGGYVPTFDIKSIESEDAQMNFFNLMDKAFKMRK